MSKNKRFSISIKENDLDLVKFINCQQNASLSMRYLCKKWIAQYGINDVVDYSATHSTVKRQKQPLNQKNKQSEAHPIGNAISDAKEDFNEDFDKI